MQTAGCGSGCGKALVAILAIPVGLLALLCVCSGLLGVIGVKPSKRANRPTSSQSATVVAGDDEALDQLPDEFPTAVPPAEPVPPQEPTETAPVDSEPMEIEPIAEPSQHPPREWRDQTGKFRVTATFISFANGVVSIRKEDGTVIKIPVTKLSDADRSYIQEQRYHKIQP